MLSNDSPYLKIQDLRFKNFIVDNSKFAFCQHTHLQTFYKNIYRFYEKGHIQRFKQNQLSQCILIHITNSSIYTFNIDWKVI